ncbi:MAG: hypothetical protein V4591_00865 [Bdellovibrionota bacterium]
MLASQKLQQSPPQPGFFVKLTSTFSLGKVVLFPSDEKFWRQLNSVDKIYSKFVELLGSDSASVLEEFSAVKFSPNQVIIGKEHVQVVLALFEKYIQTKIENTDEQNSVIELFLETLATKADLFSLVIDDICEKYTNAYEATKQKHSGSIHFYEYTLMHCHVRRLLPQTSLVQEAIKLLILRLNRGFVSLKVPGLDIFELYRTNEEEFRKILVRREYVQRIFEDNKLMNSLVVQLNLQPKKHLYPKSCAAIYNNLLSFAEKIKKENLNLLDMYVLSNMHYLSFDVVRDIYTRQDPVSEDVRNKLSKFIQHKLLIEINARLLELDALVEQGENPYATEEKKNTAQEAKESYDYIEKWSDGLLDALCSPGFNLEAWNQQKNSDDSLSEALDKIFGDRGSVEPCRMLVFTDSQGRDCLLTFKCLLKYLNEGKQESKLANDAFVINRLGAKPSTERLSSMIFKSSSVPTYLYSMFKDYQIFAEPISGVVFDFLTDANLFEMCGFSTIVSDEGIRQKLEKLGIQKSTDVKKIFEHLDLRRILFQILVNPYEQIGNLPDVTRDLITIIFNNNKFLSFFADFNGYVCAHPEIEYLLTQTKSVDVYFTGDISKFAHGPIPDHEVKRQFVLEYKEEKDAYVLYTVGKDGSPSLVFHEAIDAKYCAEIKEKILGQTSEQTVYLTINSGEFFQHYNRPSVYNLCSKNPRIISLIFSRLRDIFLTPNKILLPSMMQPRETKKNFDQKIQIINTVQELFQEKILEEAKKILDKKYLENVVLYILAVSFLTMAGGAGFGLGDERDAGKNKSVDYFRFMASFAIVLFVNTLEEPKAADPLYTSKCEILNDLKELAVRCLTEECADVIKNNLQILVYRGNCNYLLVHMRSHKLYAKMDETSAMIIQNTEKFEASAPLVENLVENLLELLKQQNLPAEHQSAGVVQFDKTTLVREVQSFLEVSRHQRQLYTQDAEIRAEQDRIVSVLPENADLATLMLYDYKGQKQPGGMLRV